MPRIGIDARKLGDGGIGRYVGELLHRLPALMPEVEFVAAAGPFGIRRLARIAPGVRALPVVSAGYSLREHVELARAFAAERCDLVHVPHYVVPLLLRPRRLVVTVHDLIHLKQARSRLHAAYARAMLAVVRRRADLVLAPSHAVAADLSRFAGFPPERIQVVLNGVSDGFLDAAPVAGDAVGAFERLHGLEKPWVLNVTNGLPHKGLDILLAAAREIPGLGLAIAGRGSTRPEVLRAIAGGRPRDGGDGGRPVLVGEVSDAELRVAYAAATATVVASREEGFGLPALEAMAAGGLVVATRAGGLAEVCGDAAIVGPPGSVEWLREALYRVAFELGQTEREALIQRGRNRAREFPWDRSARATSEAYRRVLAGTGSP